MPTDEETAAEKAAQEEAARLAAEAAAAGGEDDDDDDDDFDPEKAKAFIKDLRQKERTADRNMRAAQRELSELKKAQMTEQEKVAAERDAALAERDGLLKEKRDRLAREAFVVEAEKAGATKPTALYKLAEGLEFDDDYKPTNAKAVIKDLKDQYPELFAAGSGDGGAGRGQGPRTQSFNDVIRSSRRR